MHEYLHYSNVTNIEEYRRIVCYLRSIGLHGISLIKWPALKNKCQSIFFSIISLGNVSEWLFSELCNWSQVWLHASWMYIPMGQVLTTCGHTSVR